MDSSESSQRESTDSERDWSIYLTSDGSPIARTWANFQAGLIPWDDLDDEELGRGKLRDRNGGWTGRTPQTLPRAMVPEITRRLKERYDEKLRKNLMSAQGVFLEIMLDTSAGPADRLRAAAYVQERLIGKVPDKVEVVAEVKPWEGLVGGVLEDVTEDEPSD